MSYLYHYSALTQHEVGAVVYGSGTITTTSKITTPEEYVLIWEGIAKRLEWEKDKTTIVSLTLLGESPDNG